MFGKYCRDTVCSMVFCWGGEGRPFANTVFGKLGCECLILFRFESNNRSDLFPKKRSIKRLYIHMLCFLLTNSKRSPRNMKARGRSSMKGWVSVLFWCVLHMGVAVNNENHQCDQKPNKLISGSRNQRSQLLPNTRPLLWGARPSPTKTSEERAESLLAQVLFTVKCLSSVTGGDSWLVR